MDVKFGPDGALYIADFGELDMKGAKEKIGAGTGKIFRLGHLGDLNELMLLGALAGAEMAMLDNGIAIEPGSGVAAAQGVWRQMTLALAA